MQRTDKRNSPSVNCADSKPTGTLPPQAEWLKQANGEGASMDISAVVPLEVDELIATARRREGLLDFGEDYWREPLAVMVKSLNHQADLNLFGRIAMRDDLLNALRMRLRIEAEYAKHPEIEDEVVDAPVMITGLARTGTSILFEILSQDRRFKALLSWEAEIPCPPPEAATYDKDPRIALAQERVTRTGRLAPQLKTMTELGALLPVECLTAFKYSFMSENVMGYCDIPDYGAYLATKADWQSTYRYHCRVLKLLQWKNPRKHWLLKSPPHMWHLEQLFAEFPDAKVIHTHRDPLRAVASGTSLLSALRGTRSDKPLDVASFAKMLRPEATAAGLEHVIDQIEAGIIPRGQIFHSHYAELMQHPIDAVRTLYQNMGFTLDGETEQRMRRYLEQKPRGKFGTHKYKAVVDADARACFARYQNYYGVENED